MVLLEYSLCDRGGEGGDEEGELFVELYGSSSKGSPFTEMSMPRWFFGLGVEMNGSGVIDKGNG